VATSLVDLLIFLGEFFFSSDMLLKSQFVILSKQVNVTNRVKWSHHNLTQPTVLHIMPFLHSSPPFPAQYNKTLLVIN